VAAIAGVSAIGTALSRLTGLGRTVETAYALGAGRVSDAYNLANTTPNIIYDLVLGGILAGTLVPVFLQALRTPEEEGGEAAGWEAISAVCTAIGVVLLGVSVLFFLGAPLIIHFLTLGSHVAQIGAERNLATSLLYLFVPQLFFYGMASVAAAILQARYRFAPQMYTPILNNVIVIGVLVGFAVLMGTKLTPDAVRHDHRAVLLLGGGTTLGVAVMALALLPALAGSGARLRLVWNPRHPACKRIFRLGSWTFGVVVANQIALLVAIQFASHKAGDYSAYSYAYMFMQLPYGVWTVSVMTPMETDMAHAWQTGDREEARSRFLESVWMVLVIILPAGLGMAALARPAIAIVLQHGALGAAGARATSDALIAMALGLPTFSLYLMLMRAYQAMQDTRTMFLIYLVENGANIILDILLYHRFGIRGLAAGLSLAYAVATVVALVHMSRRMGGIRGGALAAAAGLALIAAALAAGAAWATAHGIARLPDGQRQVGVAAQVIAGVGVGVTVYLLAARALGFDDVRRSLQLRRRTG